ncbi:MAG: outer membrane beta-barrel domain-containing protein [Deltaproteobacteria bacterium]|nr:outer membrane beta-barrel domain-containing protein [Deltaproteobacteria bacterium]
MRASSMALLAAAAFLWSGAARADDDLLDEPPAFDLSDDGGDPDPGPAPAAAPSEPDAAAPAARASTKDARAKAAEDKRLPTAPGDRVFTVGDRVKAVQKKLILKAGRFEIAPALSLSVNDPFFQKIGGGVAATFWPADNLGIFADVYSLSTIETENVRLAKQATVSTLLDSRLRFLAAGGFQWSPVYGKVAFLGKQIIHFDLFFSAGFGVVRTSAAALDDTPPLQVMTTFGVGQRYLVNRFLALFFKVEDRLYPEVFDLKAGRVSGISNVLTLSLGASIFFPMDFSYSQ